MRDNMSIEELAEKYIDSMAEDDVLELINVGSFSPNELRVAIRQRTSVGLQLLDMIRRDLWHQKEVNKRA